MQKLQINPLTNLKVKALKHLKLVRMLCDALDLWGRACSDTRPRARLLAA